MRAARVTVLTDLADDDLGRGVVVRRPRHSPYGATWVEGVLRAVIPVVFLHDGAYGPGFALLLETAEIDITWSVMSLSDRQALGEVIGPLPAGHRIEIL